MLCRLGHTVAARPIASRRIRTPVRVLCDATNTPASSAPASSAAAKRSKVKAANWLDTKAPKAIKDEKQEAVIRLGNQDTDRKATGALLGMLRDGKTPIIEIQTLDEYARATSMLGYAAEVLSQEDASKELAVKFTARQEVVEPAAAAAGGADAAAAPAAKAQPKAQPPKAGGGEPNGTPAAGPRTLSAVLRAELRAKQEAEPASRALKVAKGTRAYDTATAALAVLKQGVGKSVTLAAAGTSAMPPMLMAALLANRKLRAQGTLELDLLPLRFMLEGGTEEAGKSRRGVRITLRSVPFQGTFKPKEQRRKADASSKAPQAGTAPSKKPATAKKAKATTETQADSQ